MCFAYSSNACRRFRMSCHATIINLAGEGEGGKKSKRKIKKGEDCYLRSYYCWLVLSQETRSARRSIIS